jgi:ribosomal protein S10
MEKKVKHKKELGKRARQDRLIIVHEASREALDILNKMTLSPGVGMEISISVNAN